MKKDEGRRMMEEKEVADGISEGRRKKLAWLLMQCCGWREFSTSYTNEHHNAHTA